jgi:hypothetical protein
MALRIHKHPSRNGKFILASSIPLQEKTRKSIAQTLKIFNAKWNGNVQGYIFPSDNVEDIERILPHLQKIVTKDEAEQKYTTPQQYPEKSEKKRKSPEPRKKLVPDKIIKNTFTKKPHSSYDMGYSKKNIKPSSLRDKEEENQKNEKKKGSSSGDGGGGMGRLLPPPIPSTSSVKRKRSWYSSDEEEEEEYEKTQYGNHLHTPSYDDPTDTQDESRNKTQSRHHPSIKYKLVRE